MPKSRGSNRSAQLRTHAKTIQDVLRQLLAVILCGSLGFGQTGKTVIVPSGATSTGISTAGAVTNITTSTVRGNNAYNAFTNFKQAAGSTVNLFLPSGTSNLLNLVDSGTTQIDGTLNSILN